MIYRFVINGSLPGLNEYVDANRRNKYAAATMKRQAEASVIASIKRTMRGVRIKTPAMLHYVWYEKDRRRDKDNVAFAQKFVQDALVHVGALKNDGWAQIGGFTHDFRVDKKKPRIEVVVEEMEV